MAVEAAGDFVALWRSDGGSSGTDSSSSSLQRRRFRGPDRDGDGIDDGIDGQILSGSFSDERTVFSNQFTDQHLGGTSSGVPVGCR